MLSYPTQNHRIMQKSNKRQSKENRASCRNPLRIYEQYLCWWFWNHILAHACHMPNSLFSFSLYLHSNVSFLKFNNYTIQDGLFKHHFQIHSLYMYVYILLWNRIQSHFWLCMNCKNSGEKIFSFTKTSSSHKLLSWLCLSSSHVNGETVNQSRNVKEAFGFGVSPKQALFSRFSRPPYPITSLSLSLCAFVFFFLISTVPVFIAFSHSTFFLFPSLNLIFTGFSNLSLVFAICLVFLMILGKKSWVSVRYHHWYTISLIFLYLSDLGFVDLKLIQLCYWQNWSVFFF